MIYDDEQQIIKYVKAKNQRHAIKKAYRKFGVFPQRTDHARPWNCMGELMGVDEFEEWVEKEYNI